MIKMITAFTTEVDEVDDALNEILGQIDLGTLKKNSVGLITCHFDFISTGFLGELRRKLPFLECGKQNGTLFLPCVTRYVMLVPNHNAELELIAEKVENGRPYMVGYSGGEICPVQDEAGVLRNRFHNYTFTACVL